MRVLITVPWGERLGGAETMLQAILDGATGSGHELELVFLGGGPWPEQLRVAGFRVEVVEAGRLRNPPQFAATVWRLARIFHRRGPDLILNWSAKTQLYGSLAAAMAGMSGRVLWWQHMIPDGHWLDRIATLLPARAIGCSSRAAAAAQNRIWPSRHTFTVLPGTPIPDPQEPSADLTLPRGVPVVGMVGRLQPWKGQDRLIRAHAVLRARGENIHTLIVGGDAGGFSTDYAESLAPLTRELGLAGLVTMTGQVVQAGPYIRRMDVLVNASEHEPFGIVLLEGMARGVAVVAVGAGGPAEFIEDGETGILARTGEPDALADAIERLIESSGLRKAIATRGRARFEEEFTAGALRQRFFEALTRLTRESAT